MKAGIIAKVLGGIGLLTLLVLGVAVVANWNSLRIQYHLMLLQDARRPIQPANEAKFRYSMHWVRWLAEGRPYAITQQAMAWKHQEALIKLGYCERRAYSLTNATVIDLGKTFTGHRFKDGPIFSVVTAGSMDRIVIFAAKDDFPFLETKIKEVEEKKR
jgi:hypothetical protein